MFICLEGTDGAGKSTQANLLVDRLHQDRIPCLLVSEFSNTPIGDVIREILTYDRFIRFQKSSPTRFSESLLILSDFSMKTEELIIPALRQNTVIIADRHLDSQIAYHAPFIAASYQLNQDEFIASWMDFLHRFFPKLPDLTILLDISIEESIKRVKDRENVEMTDEELSVIGQSIKIYRWLAQHNPSYLVVDAEISIDELTDQLHRIILHRIDKGN